LALAGFHHVCLVEIDGDACETLKANRPEWPVRNEDIRYPERFEAERFRGVDLLAGGVPCPPFSFAGKQLGQDDERDLFPAILRLIECLQPRAVMIENVRGLMSPKFQPYRLKILDDLKAMGYSEPYWRIVNSSDFGVPQLRPRSILVAFRNAGGIEFEWPHGELPAPTVGEALLPLMAANGWKGADGWAARAAAIAPTLVGGSRRHGGPDLGPTRAKKAWKNLGVDGNGIADSAPGPSFALNGHPKLTTRMAAVLQGFPATWAFSGRKTSAYRQVGNAFPPPVAKAFGIAISHALQTQASAATPSLLKNSA
jgi:DNA (cytosine-5)-methyltransferase 1